MYVFVSIEKPWDTGSSQAITMSYDGDAHSSTVQMPAGTRFGGKQKQPLFQNSWTGTESWETQITSPPPQDKDKEEVGFI